MDPLSATASIIALIQGITGCWKIYSSINGAQEDIGKLQSQVLMVQELTTRIEALIRGPNGQRLTGSDELKNALKGCNTELQQLRDRLDSGYGRSRFKLLSVIKIHAKWPFTGPEVLNIVNNLERWKQSINLALNLNQVAQLMHISQKLDFAGLPFADGAVYKSYIDRHQPECLEETRVDLLRDISNWIEDPQGKCIFWLSGKAGTGKSTISRTVARNLREGGQLAASFFFRRGEKDRGDAAKFFTTLASQLANTIREIAPSIQSAIDAEPRIPSMGLREQFNRLIFEPLSQLRCSRSSNQKIDKVKAVVVIDALDECDHEEDEMLIISQLGRLNEIQAVEMRVFLTSRPELPERLGFRELSDSSHQDVVLHKVPGIERDIALFFDRQFSDIRKFHSLPDSWPATEDVQRLVQMAVPLFIFAATACRFIGDRKRDPKQRIKIVMEYQTDWRARKLEQTYFPVLHSLASDELSEPHDTLATEFKVIVGAILTLASPLSVPSLSGLLCISEPAINRMLDPLHSVLEVPSQAQRNAPIRALHLSFRDFLFDESLRSDSKFHHFWIDDKESHRNLYSKCIELMMSGTKGLKENICGLRSPGTLRREIEMAVIETRLSMELRYACRYWVYHLQQSGDCVSDGDMIHKFLQRHVLHWLEAMSLSDEIREITSIVEGLNLTVAIEKGRCLSALIQDIRRFVIRNQYIIGMAPLQTYYSAIVFTPKRSIVRGLFEVEGEIKWAKQLPRVQDEWDGLLQILYGHTNIVTSVAFSPDGKIVASASRDRTVRLWNVATGAALSTLHGHTNWITSVAFSSDGKTVASASYDNTIRLWNIATDTSFNTLYGHTKWVTSVVFSSDGKTVASTSHDNTVRLWDVATGTALNILHSHTNLVYSVAFSPDDRTVASASFDRTVRLWDAATGAGIHTLHGHTKEVTSVKFSPDGKIVASASRDETVRLWDVATGAFLNTLHDHTNWVTSVAFSPDGKTVASASYDRKIKLWDVATGFHTLHGHTSWVTSVTFSPDGKIVASASRDETVRLWDAALNTGLNDTLLGHTDYVFNVAFSPNGKIVASASRDRTIKLWNVATSAVLNTLHGHTNWVSNVAFSPDGKIVASVSEDHTVRLWDAATGAGLSVYNAGYCALDIRFSEDGQLLYTERESLKITQATDSALCSLHHMHDIRQDLHLRLKKDIPIDGEWLIKGDERFLWLPSDYRPTCSAVAGPTVCMGHQSGRVSFIVLCVV